MATAEAETSRDEQVPPGGSVYDGFISYSHAADDLLAPRLQAGLQRFAKPWWKRRALRIFRDESSLSANPHLWSSITDALDRSGWFVLLLSPEAAESPWVNNEVEYWLEHKDADRIIPILTDGEFGWADGDVAGDALPAALVGAFPDEPRWVDLRFARTEEQLDLNNPTFSAAVADIASPIRGVPKEELESEEVRQHRRTTRTAWAAGIFVLAMAIAAGGAALFANTQRVEADEQRAAAEEERARADAEADRANEEADRANELAEQEAAARRDADRNAELARSRELSASAINVLDEDAELSVLLSLAAAETDDPPIEANSALHEALSQHRVLHTYAFPEEQPIITLHTDLHPEGRHLVAGGESPYLEVWDMEQEEVVWSKEWESRSVNTTPYFTADGDRVVAAVNYWPIPGDETAVPASSELGVHVWDASTGALIASHDTGRCGARFSKFVSGSRPSSHAVLITSDFDSCVWTAAPDVDILLLDLSTGETTLLDTVVKGVTGSAISADGRVVAFDGDDGAHVVDVASGEEILGISLDDVLRVREERGFQNWNYVRSLSPDGSRLIFGDVPIQIWDTANGTVVSDFSGHGGETFGGAFFNHDGSLAFSAGRDGTARIWDPVTGTEFDVLGGAQSAGTPAMSHDGSTMLVGDLVDFVARLWDLAAIPGAELAGIETCPGFVAADSLEIAGDRAVVFMACGDDLYGRAHVIDLSDMRLERQLPWADGQMTALAPDGSRIAQLDGSDGTLSGPIRIYDADTGEAVVSMEGVCTWDTAVEFIDQPQCVEPPAVPFQLWPRHLRFSGDGSLLLGVADGDQFGFVAVWDAVTGGLLHVHNAPADPVLGVAHDAEFMDNGSRILVMYGNLAYEILDTATWEILETVELSADNPPLLGGVFARDDSYLIGSTGDLTWQDTSSWEIVRVVPDAHRGTIKDIAINASETLIATGGSDGFVRVWDFDSGALVHQIPITDGQVQTVGFVGDQHLIVTPQDGNILFVTIDTAELVELARDRVTRGLTATECLTYHFEVCPTLEDIRGR